MMTHELEVSVVAAPLEAIDRRVLSQAWYSALHLAAPERRFRSDTATRRWSRRPPACRRPPMQPHELPAPYLRPLPSLRATGAHVVDAPAPRQSPQSRLAFRIERAFTAAMTPKRATFSLGRGNARVHVVLRTTPTRTMLIALCRPELRADVGKALAQARVALAARGIALDVSKLGGRGCS